MRLLCFGLLVFCLLPAVAGADYYRFRDGQGKLCFTNTLEAIPPSCRKSAELVVEATPPKPMAPSLNPYLTVPPPTDIPPVAAVPLVSAPERGLWERMWVRLLLGATAALGMLALLVRLLPNLLPRQLARVICFAIFFGVLGFGFKLYSDSMVNAYFSIKGQVLQAFTKAQSRTPQTPAE